VNRTLVLGVMAAVVIIVAIGIWLLSGMAPQTQPRKEVKLVVITRLAPEEGSALRERFLRSDIASKAGIVDVEFRKEDIGKWRSFVESGGVDVFFVGGYAVYSSLCREGYLEPIINQEIISRASSIGASLYKDDKGNICFLSVSRTIFSFTVNNEYLSRYSLPKPRSWEDLASPSFSASLLKGDPAISFPAPSKSTTAARTLQLILQKYGWDRGWEILTIIGANSKIVESSERARDDVATGVSGAAPTVLVYGLRAVNASGGKAEFIVAEKGLLPDISPVAIAKNSKNKEAAEAFILWLLSDDGQRSLAELFYYLPYQLPRGTALEDIYRRAEGNIYPYDPEEGSRWEFSAIYYFEASIADPDANNMLKKIWGKAISLYQGGKMSAKDLEDLVHRIGSPLEIEFNGTKSVFTKDYASRINSLLTNPAYVDAFKSAVKKAAMARYSSVLSSLG
jgi:ABC-type Fe3+ transport system substrate-binding protein